MDTKLLKDFASPSSLYRGKPFWAWNGPLAPEELRRQIRIMQQMGLGGFFMHSRVGLSTEYLGEDWFECVAACVDEADKLGMEAWIYDEDRWPSGAAGGLVTKNARYRMRSLRLEEADPKGFKWADDVLAVFSATIEGLRAADIQRIAKPQLKQALRDLPEGRRLLVFRVKLNDPSPWYNGYTYLDTLNPDAVAQFIKVTHEAYRKRFGKQFGKLIPGAFTDEPNYGHLGKGTRAWTDKLPAVFKKRYGYDILDHLPELFYIVEGRRVSKVRWNYYDCITHLFVSSFSQQIGEWCGKAGIQFTGHMLMEDTLRSQTEVVGSCMRHYEYMQAPGMDLLTEHWRCYITAKQVASAARQFGWKWRLTETYGCTGWDFSFEGHKALGDWQAANGINLRCQHLSWYTMLGQAKRDYPAGIFYQSPWWEYYRKIEDYFGRITAVMTRGAEVRDLLVIHPVESVWAMAHRDFAADAEVADFDQAFNDVTCALLENQIDYDYGDEELLARHGKVIAREGEPAVFKVAKAAYKAILVPPTKTLRSGTLALLQKFAAAGGKVVFAGEVAQCVDAEPSDAVAQFAATCAAAPIDGSGLADAVAVCRRVRVLDAAGNAPAPVLYYLREGKDHYYLFVCNTSYATRKWGEDPLVRDRMAAFPELRISGFADCQGAPVELDPDTGAIHAASAVRDSAGWTISTSLPRIGSRLFVVPKQPAAADAPPRPQPATVRTDALGAGAWDITLSEPNNLVLDRPRYKIGNGDWQPATEILRVDRAVRQALGVPARGGSMVQPWARELPEKPKRAVVTLSYEFDAGCLPSGELALAIEQPQRFGITFNGQPISTDCDTGWWTDRSLATLPIDPSLVRLGRNEIVMECRFDETFSGLEICYLLGNFGTEVRGAEVAIVPPPAALRLGDWVGQGLAFYSGSVTYRRRIAPRFDPGQRVFVSVGQYRGAAVRVLVDGKPAGIIAWEPNEVDITDLLGQGTAELGLQVLGHRRNSHGPLHHKEKWPQWTGPAEYITEGDKWVETYQLVPCGLMSEPQLIIRAV